MDPLVVVVFTAALGIILWSATVVVIGGKAGAIARYAYVALTVILAITAFWTTYRYDEYWNEYTHAYGWPVPRVLFQRDDPTDPNSPWLDFIGPTVILAFPMNFIIFMFIPSLTFLGIAYVRSWYSKKRAMAN